jgi:hypothetical protein
MRIATIRRTHHDDDTGVAASLPARRLVAACAMVAALGAAMLQMPAAFAQGACTEIESDAERLACYDRALRPARPAPAAPAAAPAQAQPAQPAQPATPAAGQAPAREVRGASRATEVPLAPAPAAAPAASSALTADLGTVLIVATRAFDGRPVIFTTDTGDVWVQTDGQRFRVPETPFSAEIKGGAMNSRFLVPEKGRAVRVTRHKE